jgi:hypothetical protein
LLKKAEQVLPDKRARLTITDRSDDKS